MPWALGEQEGPFFGSSVRPGVEEQPIFAVDEEEQHAFEQEVTLEHDCASPVVAPGTSFLVPSKLAVEWLFVGLTGGNSVVCVTQQQGIPIMSVVEKVAYGKNGDVQVA